MLERQRRGIQLIPMLTPTWHVPVHQGHKSIRVTSFKKVKLARGRQDTRGSAPAFCKLQVQPDAARLGVA
jgi:hypothetical protein